MTVRRLAWTALVGLSLGGQFGFAGEPAPINLPAANLNQQLADSVAATLRQSAVLRQYAVEVNVRGGDVELRGQVADQAQREEVLRLVQGVPGVVRVLDQMSLASAGKTLVRVQGPAIPPRLPEPSASPNGSENKVPEVPKAGSNQLPEPAPIGGSMGSAMGQMNPPGMPPYAWPTYAPYNNYSRVAYPTAYPWQAFPFIGPMYPFPKVPLGWRSVKLEFDDGYWWYGQVGNKYNWWKIRYW
ncbi:MAG: BON domain-containing protein [Gemmataceae bacterium]